MIGMMSRFMLGTEPLGWGKPIYEGYDYNYNFDRQSRMEESMGIEGFVSLGILFYVIWLCMTIWANISRKNKENEELASSIERRIRCIRREEKIRRGESVPEETYSPSYNDGSNETSGCLPCIAACVIWFVIAMLISPVHGLDDKTRLVLDGGIKLVSGLIVCMVYACKSSIKRHRRLAAIREDAPELYDVAIQDLIDMREQVKREAAELEERERQSKKELEEQGIFVYEDKKTTRMIEDEFGFLEGVHRVGDDGFYTTYKEMLRRKKERADHEARVKKELGHIRRNPQTIQQLKDEFGYDVWDKSKRDGFYTTYKELLVRRQERAKTGVAQIATEDAMSVDTMQDDMAEATAAAEIDGQDAEDVVACTVELADTEQKRLLEMMYRAEAQHYQYSSESEYLDGDTYPDGDDIPFVDTRTIPMSSAEDMTIQDSSVSNRADSGEDALNRRLADYIPEYMNPTEDERIEPQPKRTKNRQKNQRT